MHANLAKDLGGDMTTQRSSAMETADARHATAKEPESAPTAKAAPAAGGLKLPSSSCASDAEGGLTSSAAEPLNRGCKCMLKQKCPKRAVSQCQRMAGCWYRRVQSLGHVPR